MVGIVTTLTHDMKPGLLAALSGPAGLLASAAVVFGVGKLVPKSASGGGEWYRGLKKPSWNPPNWVFPAVWIPLKIMQSVALWQVCTSAADAKAAALPVAIFVAHLFLGNYWNITFFGRHQMKESIRVMGTFWASIAGTIAAFATVSPLAAWLMAPTQVWVTIASKLNWDIVQLNTGAAKGGNSK